MPFNDTLWANTNAILNYSRFGIGGSAFRVGVKPDFVDSVPFGAFPRTVFEKVGGMREDLPRAEDNEYNSRIRKLDIKYFQSGNSKFLLCSSNIEGIMSADVR